MIFRLSQKLGTKIKAGSLKEMPLGENPIADWSAHLFHVGRTQYILVTHSTSLYSTLLTAKGINDQSQFIQRALAGIRESMRRDGLEVAYQCFISPESGKVHFGKALSRAVTGSMNEMIKNATWMLNEGALSPSDAGRNLNGFIYSAIAPSKAKKYGNPQEVFKTLVAKAATKS